MEKYSKAAKTTRENMALMRISSYVPKAKNTYAEYVLLIALPLQQWLHDRVSVLR